MKKINKTYKIFNNIKKLCFLLKPQSKKGLESWDRVNLIHDCLIILSFDGILTEKQSGEFDAQLQFRGDPFESFFHAQQIKKKH